jgi:hypothetical protein
LDPWISTSGVKAKIVLLAPAGNHQVSHGVVAVAAVKNLKPPQIPAFGKVLIEKPGYAI